jgi:hypothetical protein
MDSLSRGGPFRGPERKFRKLNAVHHGCGDASRAPISFYLPGSNGYLIASARNPERASALRFRKFCVAETVCGGVFHRFLPSPTPPNPRKNKRAQNELASVAPHS